MGRLKSSAATIERRLRQHKALELRLAGYELAEIAKELGYAGPSGAYVGIQAALRRACPEETVEKMRVITMARLNRLLRAVWPLAIAQSPDLQALDRAIKLLERMCRLHGLDKPIEIKSDMIIATYDPLEKFSIEELGNLAELFAKYTPEDLNFLANAGSAALPGGDGQEAANYQ